MLDLTNYEMLDLALSHVDACVDDLNLASAKLMETHCHV